MSKTKFTKVLLLVGVFVATFSIGYFGMNLAGQTGSTKNKIGEVIEEPNGGESKPQDDSTISSPNDSEPQDSILTSESSDVKNETEISPVQKIELRATRPRRSGDGYSFKATCQGVADGESVHYELWSDRKIQSSTDGLFTGVPSVGGGSYKLCLVGNGNRNLATIRVSGFVPQEAEHTQDVQEKAKKMLISQSEFQTRMLNPNDNTLKMARRATDKKSPLAHNFTLKVVGMSPSENKCPSDVEGVREKIHFGIWKSATVTELAYNESTGQVVQATITPNY